jgi:predicted 3-demethylubiquinone-9 3-methyltransferase (glyoxalase superfamily)
MTGREGHRCLGACFAGQQVTAGHNDHPHPHRAKSLVRFQCQASSRLSRFVPSDSSEMRTSHYLTDRPGTEGKFMTIACQPDGLISTAINGGPQFKFNESLSLLIKCKD